MPKKYKPVVERFWEKVKINEETGCWEWIANKDSYGYGQFTYNGNTIKAHRLAWKIMYGDIPEGMSVLHKCDNPSCVNYFHLFLGSQKDNMVDMVTKGRRGIGNSRLTKQDVSFIRILLRANIKQEVISQFWGVDQKTISNIKRNVAWKHLNKR